jgi:hypothetical protein
VSLPAFEEPIRDAMGRPFEHSSDEPDAAPASDFEYACQTCGVELSYSGRGRHPKYCDEHKKTGSTKRASSGSGNLAKQAAAVLEQTNALIAGAMMLMPRPYNLANTGVALAEANDEFVVRAEKALQSNPKLCKFILKGGAISGQFGLVTAYGLLVGSVLPTAMQELRENRQPV